MYKRHIYKSTTSHSFKSYFVVFSFQRVVRSEMLRPQPSYWMICLRRQRLCLVSIGYLSQQNRYDYVSYLHGEQIFIFSTFLFDLF